MARILVVTPDSQGVRTGNTVTGERLRQLLGGQGHGVEVASAYTGQVADVLIAMHAKRGAASLQAFRQDQPDRPILLILTGTDLYGDMQEDPASLAALCAATRLVVLQSAALEKLDPEQRSRARVVHQSVVLPEGLSPEPAPGLQVCVVGHLRPVKDPLRMAQAARLLPPESEVRVVQLGAALSPELETAAREEDASNPRYTWRGEVSADGVFEVMASSHLHVLTSKSEGGPSAICEAIALGLPTVTSRIDGALGTLGTDYPGTFPFGDTKALAAMVGRFELDASFRDDLVRRTDGLRSLVDPATETAAWQAILDELAIPSPSLAPTAPTG